MEAETATIFGLGNPSTSNIGAWASVEGLLFELPWGWSDHAVPCVGQGFVELIAAVGENEDKDIVLEKRRKREQGISCENLTGEIRGITGFFGEEREKKGK